MAKNEAIKFEDLISIFQYQGVITIKQAHFLLNCNTDKRVAENTVRDTLNRYCGKNARFGNAIFWSGNAPKRTWIKENGRSAGARENMYSLREEGSALLYQYEGIDKKPPNDKNDKNILHALALVDIAAVCVSMKLPCQINRQVNYIPKEQAVEKPEEKKVGQKYIRPDIQLHNPNSQKTTFIEYEQTRRGIDLFHMVVERMARWEEVFTGPEADTLCKEIIVLFGLDDDDNFTIETWMRALSVFEKRINHHAHFSLYQRDFKEFIEHPSFDVSTDKYKRIEASDEPEQTLEQLENQERTLQAAEQICSALDGRASSLLIDSYAKESHALFEALQNASNRQTFFFSQVQKLHALSHDIERTGYAEASKPWAGILLIQKWLEQSQLSKLRADLAESITTIYALSKKNQQSAAMAYEQMVWDVLLKFFNFASGGPLHFRVTACSAESMDRVYDLVPDIEISTPWNGVFEDKNEAEQCKEAIDWFITMIVRYQSEIGLLKSKSARAKKQWANHE